MGFGELWRRIAFLRRGRRFDTDLDEELRFNAAMKADAYRAQARAPGGALRRHAPSRQSGRDPGKE